MEQILETESIQKYLLGELTLDEQTKVETRLFTDERYFNELLLVENELTDDFVFGVFSDQRQKQIENYLSHAPHQQEKVRFTRALEQYLSEHVAIDTSNMVWEEALAEAQENRYLIATLVDQDWMGLQLLALLRSSPHDKLELANEMHLDAAAILPALIRLLECGVIEEKTGRFSCTRLGVEILGKIEEGSGLKVTAQEQSTERL